MAYKRDQKKYGFVFTCTSYSLNWQESDNSYCNKTRQSIIQPSLHFHN